VPDIHSTSAHGCFILPCCIEPVASRFPAFDPYTTLAGRHRHSIFRVSMAFSLHRKQI